MIAPMLGPSTAILTLQNGVDSVAEIAALYGESAVIGGTTYIATSIAAPGVIEQNGTHRRVIVGEVFGNPPALSERVQRDSGCHGRAPTSRRRRSETVACRSGRSSSFS